MGWTANWWTVGVQGIPFHCTFRLQASLRAGTGEAHWKINPSSIQQHEQHYTWFMDRITPINYLHVRGMGCAVVQTAQTAKATAASRRHYAVQYGTVCTCAVCTVQYLPSGTGLSPLPFAHAWYLMSGVYSVLYHLLHALVLSHSPEVWNATWTKCSLDSQTSERQKRLELCLAYRLVTRRKKTRASTAIQ